MDAELPFSNLFLRGRLRQSLSKEEEHRLEAMISETADLKDGSIISRRGELCHRSTLLVDGFVLRNINSNGKRHIVCIQVPGDFVDLHGFALRRLDHDLVTVGAARVAYVPHEELNRTMEELPHLTRVLWFATLLDAAIHREWIMKMEQLTADNRLAHLFCELWHRLNFVGRADPDGYDLPLTQIDLADTCGTTSIHMNRIIGKLRRMGLVEFKRGRVTIPDRQALEQFARFTPDYLYGDGELHLPSDF